MTIWTRSQAQAAGVAYSHPLSNIMNRMAYFGPKTGVQPLLDGVLSYLPCPTEVSSYALDLSKNEEKVLG
uniref:Uncharacterized protein n=1 Tax=Quercus lobata TaxID=97700 RepID=A0A7N2MBY3_QUELO